MIAKIFILILLAILLSHLYFDWTFWRRRLSWWQRLLVWMVPLGLMVFTWLMARTPDYFPENTDMLDAYMFCMMCYIVPAAILALCMFIGRLMKSRFVAKRLSWVLALLVALAWIYGYAVGFYQFEVRHVELTFDDLPEAFDGYRVVQWSDAHVGTLTGGRQEILKRCVDSINAQQADVVAFVGDMQNMRPSEVEPFQKLLGSIRARDGVYSVLGNHDYPEYTNDDDFTKSVNLGRAIRMQEDVGWTVLCNSRQIIRRDGSLIAIAGMENDGEGRFPQLGDIQNTLMGLQRHHFVIMLEHDPTSWRRKILPHSHVQLTLSGHTHGGQLNVFGLSPACLRYHEYDGTYYVGNRVLQVTSGLGGVIPFRLGIPGEIVVITLKSGKAKRK